MGAPLYVGVGAISQGIAAVSVAWPADHRPRDLALLLIECSGLDSTANPGGWSHVSGSPLVDVASTAGSKFQVLWKRASSSAEAAVALPDLGDHTVACIAVFRGGLLGGNPFSAVTALKATASTAASAPAISTMVPNTLVIGLISRPNDSNAAIFLLANTELSAFTECFEAGSNRGNGGGFGLWIGLRAAPGAVAASSGTQSTSTTNCSFSLALPPERRVTRSG